MKRFLNIFLAVSLFFNLGFAFSGAKASPVPVPLSYTDNVCYDSRTITNPIIVLKRLTALESVLTGFILGQNVGTICGIDSDVNTGDISVVRQGIRNTESDYSNLFYNTEFDPSTKAAVKVFAEERVNEIRAKLLIDEQRISDLQKLFISIYTSNPLIEPVSGVDTSDGNLVRQEYYRAKAYKAELIDRLEIWQLILQTDFDYFKITSISPTTAMAGQQITIRGVGFDKALAISFSNSTNNFNTGLTINPSDIISPTEIRITLPSSLTDGVLNIGIINDQYFKETLKENILTISNVENNTCKCPSGQVSLSVGGIKRCAVLNTNNISCNRYGNRPVCGCDGTTYQNSCYALINGLKTYTNGACQGQ